MIIIQLINLRSAVRSFATPSLKTKKKTEKRESFYTISFKRSFFKTLKEGKKTSSCSNDDVQKWEEPGDKILPAEWKRKWLGEKGEGSHPLPRRSP